MKKTLQATATTIEYTHMRAFKARFRAAKPHFIQKVCSCRFVIDDAYKRHFHSFVSVFLPKLTPQYQKPCIMLHIGNGSGSILMRIEDPKELAKKLEEIVIYLRSDNLLENFEYMQDLSGKLHDGESISLDGKFIDELAYK